MTNSHKRDSSEMVDSEWTLGDLVDFELLIEARQEDSVVVGALKEEDARIRDSIRRSVTKEEAESRRVDSPVNRRWWLKRWLNSHLSGTSSRGASAGQMIEQSISAIGSVMTGFGGLLGIFAAAGLLGTATINVRIALGVFAGPQILLLLVAASRVVGGNRGESRGNYSPILHLCGGGITWLWRHIIAGLKVTPGSRQRIFDFKRGLNLLMSRADVRRQALVWPLLVLLQRAGTAFAITVAVTVFLILEIAHVNIGWETSDKGGTAESVHTQASWIATPWNRILPEGEGYPTLEEVRRTQLFRGRPLPQVFPTTSLWNRFLALSLLVYVFFPRLALLYYSKRRANLALAREDFGDLRSERLFRRLAYGASETEQSDFRSERDSRCERLGSTNPVPVPSATSDVSPSTGKPGATQTPLSAGQCIALTELDLAKSECEWVLKRIREELGLVANSIHRVYGIKEQESAFNLLNELHWADGRSRIVLVYRGSDPIVASLKNLAKRSLEHIGRDGHLVFGLVGRTDLSDPVEQFEADCWRELADELRTKHPNIETEILSEAQQ